MSKEARASVKKVIGGGVRSDSLEVRKPDKVILAVDMLADGESMYAVKKATGLGHDALVRLRLRHKDAIEVRRMKAADDAERLMGRYMALSEEKAQQMEDNPELLAKVNPKDLVLSASIMADKSSQLRGLATGGAGDSKQGASLEDVQKAIEEASERVRMKRVGESVDV